MISKVLLFLIGFSLLFPIEAGAQIRNRDVVLDKTQDYYQYVTRVKCATYSCADEPVKYSCKLQGRLPLGITNYGFSKGFCFKYKGKDEVLIMPRIHQTKTPDSPLTIMLHRIDSGTDYCVDNYDTISPYYTLWERLYYGDGGRWKEFPKDHVAFILRGDIAEIYVIARREKLLNMLSVIISGCHTTKEFDLLWAQLQENL